MTGSPPIAISMQKTWTLAAGAPFEAIADEWGAFSPDGPQTLERAADLIAPHDPGFAAEVAAFSGYIVETGLSAG